jgi:hypothetical protein
MLRKSCLFLFILIVLLLFGPLSRAQSVGWFSPNWLYRSTVTIGNPGGTALSAYQVHIVLGSGFDFTKAQANGADIQFTAGDGVTAIPYWLESWNASSSAASLWVNVPSIPAAGTTIYMYYGNASATSASNGNATFNFFDDFSYTSGGKPALDPSKWSFPAGQGGFSNAGGMLYYNGPNAGFGPRALAMQNSSTYGFTNGIVEYNLMNNGGFDELGLMYRGQNPETANSYIFYPTTWNAKNSWQLYARKSSSSVYIANGGSVSPGVWYTVKAAVNGTSHTLWINGTSVISASDAGFSSGTFGLMAWGNTVSSVTNFRLRQYAAIEPTMSLGIATTNGVVAASVTLNPTVVVGGTSSQGTVTLTGPAPTGGATVTLTSSNTAAAQVPANVVVTAGATSATFTITTSSVSSATSSDISASFGSASPSALLTVAQGTPTVSSVSLNPDSVAGPNSSQATVTLSGPALSGGATVTLTSSNTAAAQAPASVVVPAAATSATFTITTSVVASSTSSTISANYNSTTQTATLNITTATVSVLTYHNDNLRTGQNINETILTPANVNSKTFGKLFSLPVDGQVFGQPIYMPGVTVGTQVHNLLFVATENDSVYAWDADTASTTPVWRTSFINSANGVTAIPCGEAASGDCATIYPSFGITSTPVIDPSTGTLYVVAATKEVSGSTTNYLYRLHALSVTTGQEKFGGPVVIQATSGSVTLVPKQHIQRPALLLVNGVVYIGFGSHGDMTPWYGWLIGYNSSTLQQVLVFNTAPNAGGASIWQSGGGPAADASGYIYFNTGNGGFDADTGGSDYGDSVVKLSSGGVVQDYFTPSDQASLASSDNDLGSSGLVLLPDQPGTFAHVLITGGKQGVIYSVDRDTGSMGKFNSSTNQNIQSLAALTTGPSSGGLFGSPAYWNEYVYFSAWNDFIKAFHVSNGVLAQTSLSSITLAFPGSTPSVSSNGTSNGIVWVIQANIPNDTVITNPPTAVLRAYDATNLANELYDSTQAAGNRDAAGGAVKFAVPTIVNGKVYLGNSNQVTVYGILH